MASKMADELRQDRIAIAGGRTLPQGSSLGLKLYLLFMISWLLHVPARIEVLGAMRIDLVLVLILTGLAILHPRDHRDVATGTSKWLKILIAYALLTVPLVEWPGSVLKNGFPNLVKAVVFYYFTVAFVRTETDLRRVVAVFVGCQTFRFLEPLYLHLTQGYWGSRASMAGWEYLDRLAGAPSDVVNPNGLAWVVCTVLPFLYFFMGLSWRHRLAAIVLIPSALYALFLTGSRSGLIGVAVIVMGIVLKSKRPVVLLLAIAAAASVAFSLLSSDLQDRYLSIIGMGAKNAGTADERVEGMASQIEVMLHRPTFGHGLGTSAEANANFTTSGPYAGMEMPAHNLYIEVGQELGLVGLAIFLMFMKSIYSGFMASKRFMQANSRGLFLSRLVDSSQVWLAMNFVFSFASYGLSSFDWYLFSGISVVIVRLVQLAGEPKPKDDSLWARSALSE